MPDRSIFFIVNTSTIFEELFRLAKLLMAEGIRPIFYFTFGHWTAERDMQRCRDAGMRVVTDDPISPPTMFRRHAALRDFFARRPTWPLATVLSEALSEALSLRISLARAGKLLEDCQLLILSCDLVGYDSAAYVKAAHRQGKKALIVTSIMSNGFDVAEFFYRDPQFHVTGWLDRAIAKWFPGWVLLRRGRELFRVQPPRILAMEMLRLAPPKPWLFNSSYADVITIESEAMVEYSGGAGMPREQMHVVGSTADDLMAEAAANADARRAELCRSFGLPPDRPVILTALPPDFLYVAGGRPECEFSDYRALVDFWVKSLCAVDGYNVIISMHPSTHPDEMRFLEEHGARIAAAGTPQLIPLCEFFAASVSSTIRWAIACGKPVVDYDIYGYDYKDDFDDIGGVISVSKQSDFHAALNRLAHDKAFYAECRDKQLAVSRHWLSSMATAAGAWSRWSSRCCRAARPRRPRNRRGFEWSGVALFTSVGDDCVRRGTQMRCARAGRQPGHPYFHQVERGSHLHCSPAKARSACP